MQLHVVCALLALFASCWSCAQAVAPTTAAEEVVQQDVQQGAVRLLLAVAAAGDPALPGVNDGLQSHPLTAHSRYVKRHSAHPHPTLHPPDLGALGAYMHCPSH